MQPSYFSEQTDLCQSSRSLRSTSVKTTRYHKLLRLTSLLSLGSVCLELIHVLHIRLLHKLFTF